MDKALVRLYVPILEKEYDILIPLNRKIGDAISLIKKGICNLNKNDPKILDNLILFNKTTAERYKMDDIIMDTDIRNATELILL